MVRDYLSEGIPSHQVSSSYLTILNRHLSLVESEKQRCAPKFDHSNVTLSYTIDIDKIRPTLKRLEQHLGRANFGLDIGKQMHPSDYGIFGYAMMNCVSLYDALKTAAQHKAILNQKLFASFVEDQDFIYYQVNTDLSSKESQILIELDFSTALEFAKRLAGPSISGNIKLSSVHFSHKPLGPREQYEDYFGCPVYFEEANNRIVIRRENLEIPIYGANPKVLSALEDQIAKVASRYEGELRLSQRVAMYLRKHLRGELPSAKTAANDFYMSLSLFKKRLSEEGTGYKSICEEVRYKRCLELMNKDRTAIKEIAFELGFANASAFNRAFKRWTGTSPTEYKKQYVSEALV